MKIFIIFALAVGIFSDDIINDEDDSSGEFSGSFPSEQFADSAEDQATENPGNLIINGTRAIKGQFPYQVRLLLKRTAGKRIYCGGALIDKNWVITAAHCVEDLAEVEAHLGSIKNISKVTRIVGSSCVYSHEHYKKKYVYNDIALIYIPAVEYTTQILPVKLPSIAPPYPDYAGRYGIVSGWGLISNQSERDEYLRYVNVSIMSNSECDKFYKHLRDSNICTNASSGGHCGGDSGGPLVLEPDRLLIGIVSYHSKIKGICALGQPRVFARVTYYLEWIKNKTGIFN